MRGRRSGATLLLSLTLLSVLGRSAAQIPPTFTINASRPLSGSSGLAIPPNFVGVSVETANLLKCAPPSRAPARPDARVTPSAVHARRRPPPRGDRPTAAARRLLAVYNPSNPQTPAVNAPYARLLAHLASYSGGAAGPNVRVGGNSVQTSEWAPSGQPLDANVTYRITAADLSALAAALPLWNGSATVGLYAATASVSSASVAYAATAQAALAGLLDSLEVGNEPDQYVSKGYRPASYGPSAFAAEAAAYAAALATAGVPAALVQGPVTYNWFGSATAWTPAWTGSYAAAAAGAGNLGAVSVHYYPLNVCSGGGPSTPGWPTPAPLRNSRACWAGKGRRARSSTRRT